MEHDRRVSEYYSVNHITTYLMYQINTLYNKLIQYICQLYLKNVYIIPKKKRDTTIYYTYDMTIYSYLFSILFYTIIFITK